MRCARQLWPCMFDAQLISPAFYLATIYNTGTLHPRAPWHIFTSTLSQKPPAPSAPQAALPTRRVTPRGEQGPGPPFQPAAGIRAGQGLLRFGISLLSRHRVEQCRTGSKALGLARFKAFNISNYSYKTSSPDPGTSRSPGCHGLQGISWHIAPLRPDPGSCPTTPFSSPPAGREAGGFLAALMASLQGSVASELALCC